MKLSNNPSFVILIFAILKFEIQIVLHFVTPIPIGVQISEDAPVPGEDIRVPEGVRVPEHFRSYERSELLVQLTLIINSTKKQ